MIAFLLSLALAAPPEPPAVVKAETDVGLEAKFRQTEGWLGADGSFSVPLSETRTAWLFSDTWIGKIEGGKRKPTGLVNNTVGIQEGAGADMKVTFAIQKDEDGKHDGDLRPARRQGLVLALRRPSRRRQTPRLPAANGETRHRRRVRVQRDGSVARHGVEPRR